MLTFILCRHLGAVCERIRSIFIFRKRLRRSLSSVGAVDPQGPAVDLITVEVPGRIQGRSFILEFTETKSLWPTSLPVVDNPAKRHYVKGDDCRTKVSSVQRYLNETTGPASLKMSFNCSSVIP